MHKKEWWPCTVYDGFHGLFASINAYNSHKKFDAYSIPAKKNAYIHSELCYDCRVELLSPFHNVMHKKSQTSQPLTSIRRTSIFKISDKYH